MKISVCIATYNGEKFIKEQIESILCQLNEDDEILITDDSSSDCTIEIINSINDKRIRIYKNQRFYSPIFNFEFAIKMAKGEIIFLSDQDDIWAKNKVETYLKKLDEFDLIFSNVTIIDENGYIKKKLLFKNKPSYDMINTILSNNVVGGTIAFKNWIKDIALPFPRRIPMHDQWLALIACYYGKVGYIEQPMLYHRRHGSNASFCSEKSKNRITKKIMFRFNIAICLIKTILSKHVYR